MPDDLDALADELYALPLDRFVPERDVLVKQLRAGGRREDAAVIAALAKPSVVAWAVNQVVRAQRDAAAALWAAGDEVLDVQARLVAGDAKGPELRAAIEGERAALAPLTDAARGLMTASGKFLSDANVTAVAETLHAAAIDRDARPEVAAGRVGRPLRLTGLAATPTSAPRSDPPKAPRAAAKRRVATPSKAEQLALRAAQDKQAEAERRRLAREERARRKVAEQALLRAERERDRARERIAAAVAARDAAAQALADAEQRLADAEHGLATAHEELEHAEDAVEHAQQEVQP